jgi:hypothetical protein
MEKPIRQQLCKKCLEIYRKFENKRRQKIRLKAKVVCPETSGKIKINKK